MVLLPILLKNCFYKIFLGGSIQNDGPVKVLEDKELKQQPSPRIVKVSKNFFGGNLSDMKC